MTHDNSWPVAMKFMQIGASKIYDNRQVIMVSYGQLVATCLVVQSDGLGGNRLREQ